MTCEISRLRKAARIQSAMGALVASSLLVVASCATAEIGALDPRPRVSLPATTHVTQLLLGATIEDAFDIPTRGQAPAIRIQAWRTTLKRGFQHAFGGSTHERAAAGDGLAIRIDRADLLLIDARIDHESDRAVAWLAAADDDRLPIILAHGSPKPPKAPTIPARWVYAEINYSAVLLDANRQVVARSSGSVSSNRSTGPSVSASDVVRIAVESLFERIASDLFPSPAHHTSRQGADRTTQLHTGELTSSTCKVAVSAGWQRLLPGRRVPRGSR